MTMSSFLKLLSLGAITIALLIALGAVHDLVREREGRRQEAFQSVAAGAGGQIVLGPPVLRIVRRGALEGAEPELVLPTSVTVSADVDVEERRRGIFNARVFTANQRIKARFDLPADLEPGTSAIHEGSLEVRVSDLRGLHGAPKITWLGVPRTVSPGASGATGFHADLGTLNVSAPGSVECEIELIIGGTGSLMWTPAAGELLVDVRSPWKHPSFVGSFLPSKRNVSDGGFSAQWAVTDLATGLARDGGARTLQQATYSNFGLSLIEPVDSYALVSRATKFGVLFVLVTMVALLLVERLAGITLHPVQFGLAGAAVTVFFLVLLALAEHLSFGVAFGAGTLACVGLLTTYLMPVLGSTRRGLAAGSLFAAMYGLLFTLLHAEDQALLFGTGFVFALLTVLMLGTRKVDWSKVGASTEPPPPPPPAGPVEPAPLS